MTARTYSSVYAEWTYNRFHISILGPYIHRHQHNIQSFLIIIGIREFTTKARKMSFHHLMNIMKNVYYINVSEHKPSSGHILIERCTRVHIQ